MSTQLTPTIEQIETLRDLFFKKLEREGTPFEDGFDRRDIDRIETSNRWLQLFLEQCDLDMKQSLKMIWETCIWRKDYGANDLGEENINRQYLNSGVIFPRNTDIDGKSLLIFKSKLHQRGKSDVNELIRVLVYWIERLQRQDNYDQITILFDMYTTGLSNLDMDFTKRVVDTFKLYYPNSLNYIVIYEMPWVLSAAFKIIKSLLPPKGVARMRFVTMKTMNTIISEENILSCWGGKDNYEFAFEPESHSTNGPSQNIASQPAQQDTSSDTDTVYLSARKVHFANSSPPESPMSETSTSTFNDRNDAELLRITPDVTILFTKSGNDFLGTVDILNISEGNVTYKIKTTSPEKFRVRPSSGCLSAGANTTINVVLQQGHPPLALIKDKFLVMCMALTPETATNTQSISDLWKNTPSNSPLVQQRRLRCSLPPSASSDDGVKNGKLNNNGYGAGNDNDRHFNSVLSELTDTTVRLENQIKFSQNLQWITLGVFLLLSMAIVYILKQEINQSASDACNPSPPHSEL